MAVSFPKLYYVFVFFLRTLRPSRRKLFFWKFFMPLSKKQIKFLRAKCHDLKAVIMLGQKGLTDEVLNELDIALTHHELVKIKLSVDDRDLRKQLIAKICQKSQSEEVQSIGKTLTVYRVNPDKAIIELPKR